MFASCHCEKQMQQQPTRAETPKTQSEPSDAVQSIGNLVVSFYSRGNGINREAAGKLENFLIQYSQRTHSEISYRKVPWGREGEVDFCIPLAGMNSGQRDKFISSVKELLRTAETVHIMENSPCRDKK